MKKDRVMQKSTFVRGAFITTFGIVLTKILGILYVIPFHSIIGDEGGALYSYAYTIYLFFISLSTAGIPLAISRIVSEYQALGYSKAKRHAFVLGKRISIWLGVFSFLIVFLFAPFFARWILGGVDGGNSVSSVSFVIRMISFAILIGPLLSVYRGYFEGHKFMSPPSISQVLEQLFRVFIIIFGSLIALKSFKASLRTVVGVALFGATVGAFVSYFYLVFKYFRNRHKFQEKMRNVNEPIVRDKMICRKIFIYAVPFIMIDFFKSLYNYIDMFTVVKGLVRYVSYTAVNAEAIYSMLSTWAQKFNMIISAVSSGIIVSLMPHLVEGIVKKDKEDINFRIEQAFSMLLYFSLPITFGICFLSRPIWVLFYGESVFGPSVLGYYIFVGLLSSLFVTAITILQTFRDYKWVFRCLVIGVFIKLVLNYTLLRSFDSLGLPAYYGFITATLLGYLVSFILCMVILHVKYFVNFENVVKNFVDILCGSILMVFILYLCHFIFPFPVGGRIFYLFVILFYSFLGAFVYFYYMYKNGVTRRVFGNHFMKSVMRIFVKK